MMICYVSGTRFLLPVGQTEEPGVGIEEKPQNSHPSVHHDSSLLFSSLSDAWNVVFGKHRQGTAVL